MGGLVLVAAVSAGECVGGVGVSARRGGWVAASMLLPLLLPHGWLLTAWWEERTLPKRGCLHPSRAEWIEGGQDRPPSGSTLTGVVPSGTWRSKDGHWIIIGGNGNSVYNRWALGTAGVGRMEVVLRQEAFLAPGLQWPCLT